MQSKGFFVLFLWRDRKLSILGRFPAQPGPGGGLGKAPAGASLDLIALERMTVVHG